MNKYLLVITMYEWLELCRIYKIYADSYLKNNMKISKPNSNVFEWLVDL